MNITGVERMIFGVDDTAESERFLSTYGLACVESGKTGAKYRALDGSGVDIRLLSDAALPAANVNGPTMRAAVWGVSSQQELDKIAAELSTDRQIVWKDGVLESVDDDGNAIHFQVTQRKPYQSSYAPRNIAGEPAARFNQRANFDQHGPARQLGHVVYWSPDPARSMAFYTDRLGFRVTDRFSNNGGVFGRSQGHSDHHSIFFIPNRKVPPSFQHAEFTFAEVQDVFAGGHRMTKAGYETANGPGRFELGSNWYWYFKSPLGGNFELGADMDQVDDNWTPGEFENPRAAGGWAMHFNFDRARP